MNQICHYNTSKSSTFSEDQFYFEFKNIHSLSSYANEYFKIYNDFELKNSNIIRLNLVNTEDLIRKELCENIGLISTSDKYEKYNFILQLYKNLNLSEISYFFN